MTNFNFILCAVAEQNGEGRHRRARGGEGGHTPRLQGRRPAAHPATAPVSDKVCTAWFLSLLVPMFPGSVKSNNCVTS